MAALTENALSEQEVLSILSANEVVTLFLRQVDIHLRVGN